MKFGFIVFASMSDLTRFLEANPELALGGKLYRSNTRPFVQYDEMNEEEETEVLRQALRFGGVYHDTNNSH